MDTERFPWVEDLVAPDVEEGDHLDNLVIARLLYDAWSRYLDAAVHEEHAMKPTVRSITVSYDREVRPGDHLRCGVRCTGRSRHAFTLSQTLWRPPSGGDGEGETVAEGTVVLVAVDPTIGGPVPIVDAFWSEIEAAEGRTIPPN